MQCAANIASVTDGGSFTVGLTNSMVANGAGLAAGSRYLLGAGSTLNGVFNATAISADAMGVESALAPEDVPESPSQSPSRMGYACIGATFG